MQMHTPAELEARFWKALESDRTLMLGLEGLDDGRARPMNAQLEGERGPIWFFTDTDDVIVKDIARGSRALATFASKGHDIVATIRGRLSLENNRATIDNLWTCVVPACFEGAKDDPRLALLRLDAERTQIWVGASTVIGRITLFVGSDCLEECH